MKICSYCKTEKPPEDFCMRKASKDGLNAYCRACAKQYRLDNRERTRVYLQEHREKNSERWKAYGKKYSRKKVLGRHGLTEADFERMHIVQDGKCWICQKTPGDTLVVDHCHLTERVRGLLCRKCNAAIGQLGDDPQLLVRAAEYLTTQ